MVVQRQNPAYRLARGFQKAPVRELFSLLAEHPPRPETKDAWEHIVAERPFRLEVAGSQTVTGAPRK